MKVYSATFKGHHPVGTAAVVVAATEFMAITLLEAKLKDAGLPQRVDRKQLTEIPTDTIDVLILCNGDY